MSTARDKVLARARSIVFKIGSAVLADERGLNQAVLSGLVAQLARLRLEGRRVTVVTSGAVAAGRTMLAGTNIKIEGLSGKQAAAAIGQGKLMREYQDAFSGHKLLCAQVLLTREDLRSRTRFLHAKNTFAQLLDWGVIPIVNENDTVAVQELKFGDNDSLASLLLNLVEGDLFVNLTSTAGVFAANPLTAPDPADIPILDLIDNIQELDLNALCGGKTTVGTGGMYSKLLSARRAAQLGVPTLILPGRAGDIILRVFNGGSGGTWISPSPTQVSRRKYWLAYQSEPQGTIVIDEGAVEAVRNQGKSLLPGGVRQVDGNFSQGALVRICSPERQLGVGLSNYSAADLRRIMGLKRHEVAAILGNAHYPEVVHRDNLLLDAAI